MKKRQPPLPTNNKIIDSNKSVIFWLSIAFIVFFLFSTPYQAGLFNGYTNQYEGPIYSAILVSSILLILLAVYFFYNWRFESFRDLLSIYIWFVPLTYWISTIAAASVHLSKNMAYIHMMYATFFIFGLYLARNKFGAAIIQLAITVSGYAVVLYGIANMFGNAYSRDAIMFTDQGYRLTSVFQYPNAYAAFLMVIFLCSLYYIITSKKWYIVSLHALMLVPILTSFWLTLSRGGIVTFPIIFLCILPLLSLTRQLAFTFYSGIALLFTFPVIGTAEKKSTEIVQQVLGTLKPDGTVTKLGWFDSRSLGGWLFVLGFAVLGALVITLLQRFVLPLLERKLQNFSARRFSKVIFPIIAVALTLIIALLLVSTSIKGLLPDILQKRIENINFSQNSVLERGTFYKDSIKIFKDYPIIGAGGGGWASLYEKYQNNPYVSRQAHNFFLQYLNEVGLLGIFVLFLLLGAVLFLFFKKSFGTPDDDNQHLIFYFVTITLLIHSALDFEMSYVFFGSLVFLCLGGMASILSEKPVWLSRLSSYDKSRFIYPAFVAVVAIVFFVVSLVNLNANRLYNTSLSYAGQQKPLKEIIQPLNDALKLRPNHPDYLMTKISFLSQVYNQTKNEQYYEELKKNVLLAKKAEPHNRQAVEAEIQFYLIKKQVNEALQALNVAIVNYPWEISFYERSAALQVDLWNQALMSKKSSDMDKYSNGVIELYNTVQAKTEDLKKLPKGQQQGNPFNITPSLNFSMGQLAFTKGDLATATQYLQQAAASANLDEQVDPAELQRRRTYIRWYLAALIKQNKTDQPLYDKLIANSAKEKQEIDALVNWDSSIRK